MEKRIATLEEMKAKYVGDPFTVEQLNHHIRKLQLLWEKYAT